MALPNKNDLATLDYVYLGQPFVQVEAKTFGTANLDTVYQAQPFVAVAPTGYTFFADTGTFTVTGSIISLNSNRRITASGTIFTLVGNEANLTTNRPLETSKGLFVLTGANARIFKTRRRIINF
jgi:hypothetical protein